MNRFNFEGVLASLDDAEVGPHQREQSEASKFASMAAPLGQPAKATHGDFLRRESELHTAAAGPSNLADTNALSQGWSKDIRQIELELALSDEMSLAEIRERRREFLWRHHPDRATHNSEEANGQAAIANMLFDRAIQKRSRK